MKDKLDKNAGQEGADDMKSTPHIERTASGNYQFRLVIPQRLHEILGRKVIKKSLKTSDKSKAKILALDIQKFWLTQIHNAEQQLQSGGLSKSPNENSTETTSLITESGRVITFVRRKLKTLTDEEIQSISIEFLRTYAGYDDTFREPGYAGYAEDISNNFIQSALSDRVQKAIAFSEGLKNYYDLISPFVESVCQIDFDFLHEDTKLKLTRECLKSYQKAGKISADRNAGVGSYDLEEIAPTTKTYKQYLYAWDDLLKDWISHNGMRPEKTIQGFSKSLTEFKKFVSNKEIQRISVDDVNSYKSHLIDSGNYEKNTIENKLSHLRAIFEVGKMNEKIVRNVFEGRTKVGKNTNTPKSRLPFDKQGIQNIFTSSIFTSSVKINKWSNLTNCWIVAIAYATGARPEEIAQLRVEDLIKADDHYLLNINSVDSNGDLVGTIKNRNSIRKIPVHQALIHAGLLDFFEYQKNQNKTFLFDDFTPNKFGRRYAKWGDWFNKFGKETGLLTNKRSFYSFRDTFADMCRNSDIPMSIMNAFMGHSNQNISDSYGVGVSSARFNEKMQSIKLLLDIPKIECPK